MKNQTELERILDDVIEENGIAYHEEKVNQLQKTKKYLGRGLNVTYCKLNSINLQTYQREAGEEIDITHMDHEYHTHIHYKGGKLYHIEVTHENIEGEGDGAIQFLNKVFGKSEGIPLLRIEGTVQEIEIREPEVREYLDRQGDEEYTLALLRAIVKHYLS